MVCIIIITTIIIIIIIITIVAIAKKLDAAIVSGRYNKDYSIEDNTDVSMQLSKDLHVGSVLASSSSSSSSSLLRPKGIVRVKGGRPLNASNLDLPSEYSQRSPVSPRTENRDNDVWSSDDDDDDGGGGRMKMMAAAKTKHKTGDGQLRMYEGPPQRGAALKTPDDELDHLNDNDSDDDNDDGRDYFEGLIVAPRISNNNSGVNDADVTSRSTSMKSKDVNVSSSSSVSSSISSKTGIGSSSSSSSGINSSRVVVKKGGAIFVRPSGRNRKV